VIVADDCDDRIWVGPLIVFSIVSSIASYLMLPIIQHVMEVMPIPAGADPAQFQKGMAMSMTITRISMFLTPVVAAIIFLNGEGDPSASDAYRGGALTLYGLFEQSDAETLGFPLEAEEGLLITFPTDVMHEVRPVEAGERYTVVTWLVT